MSSHEVIAVMRRLDKVEAVTGHPVGGVCLVGLAPPLRIFCDQSLRAFDMVFAAAGAPDAALRLSPETGGTTLASHL